MCEGPGRALRPRRSPVLNRHSGPECCGVPEKGHTEYEQAARYRKEPAGQMPAPHDDDLGHERSVEGAPGQGMDRNPRGCRLDAIGRKTVVRDRQREKEDEEPEHPVPQRNRSRCGAGTWHAAVHPEGEAELDEARPSSAVLSWALRSTATVPCSPKSPVS